MGSSQSIPSTSEITDAPFNVSDVKEYTASTKNGPKTKSMDQTNPISVTLEDGSVTDSDASSVSTESDYSSDEEEEDEYLYERRTILEEARKLRETAGYYYHPEAPVVSDATACARCFFSRYSAPVSDPDEVEAEEERMLIFADAKNLKEIAVWHMQPEKKVESLDATAFGRNYFTRASAPEFEDDVEEERALILQEMKQLKTTAEWYMHPEKPVVLTFPGGRNYFSRPSALMNEEDEERRLILEEMKQLKTCAEWYMHPEAPVRSDATACGRNFFSRASAPVNEDEQQKELVLEEMKQLKTTAEWYMHPEKPVAVDSTACGRNFFTRPSAQTNEDEEKDSDERDRILKEMKDLKTAAEWYMHPEKPVAVDPTACGRNYFSRPSAPEYDGDDMDERVRILEEMKELKTAAEWYMQPEKPVNVDPTTFGRNYFSRPSVPVQYEDDDEREQILQEMKELKTTADWYLHPEKPVEVDPATRARNYFTRPSSEEVEDDDINEERKRVMEDVNALKTTAEWYMHPEKPVSADASSRGRNFFTRPSALDDDAGCVSWVDSTNEVHLSLDFESNFTDEMEEERKRVLAEASQLKEAASWYLEPEKPIAVDPTVFGRNYFSRPSAPEQEDVEDIEERELILSEVNELKMVADWYRSPEKEVTVYATVCGRNFFTRPSAPVMDEEEAEEREEILADAAELLKVAKWYMHPEKPVTVYATACGRNFFSRPSAQEDEDSEERSRILDEAKQLKEVAGWYADPSQPVKSDGFATARNYFSRPSGPEYTDDQEERDQVLREAHELKEVAGWYLNPEQKVKSDAFVSARNYFTRLSAPEQVAEDKEECQQILAEAKELKEIASWYLEPEKPISVDPASFGRNYFNRLSAEQVSEENQEEERTGILSDAKELKKLAVDYLHPEKPVDSSSINCARNYFDRPSGTGHADHIHTQGHSNRPNFNGDYVEQGYDFHDDYAQHEHQHHDCDVSQQSYQSHGDHFDMDEDLHGFRDSINAFRDSVVGAHDSHHIPIIKEEDDGKEGNLSRSPSSVMLFDEQAAV
eukprot:CAMPEP_0197179256 /NCGR_PEP_ID=MMETSP1423-20130617/4271_1 /TAXON_ID=476441 /ORGANISM="Pseudo-nitzschia heimii, Strain UNC1101" /LENGTH=1043 /DNA_ID=CAMNT_0042629145 /DNA_START=55 /DNA_END=3186 /DNA_ORIENTATION=-